MYGGGVLVTYVPPKEPRIQRVRGALTPEMEPTVSRALAARADVIPEAVASLLSSVWKRIPPPKENGVILRNDWHERREFVASLRPEIMQLVPVARRAVTRVGGELRPLDMLINDDLLHDDIVDSAIAQLNRARSWWEAKQVTPSRAGPAPSRR